MRCFALLVASALLGLCYGQHNDDFAANQGGNAHQTGYSSTEVNGPARVQPEILPFAGAGDSRETGNVVSMTGHIPPQNGGGQTGGMYGAVPPQSGGAAAAGDTSNSIDVGTQYVGDTWGADPNGVPVAGADAGQVMHHQDLEGSSSGMSGTAVAGVVAGVAVVGAIGTAIAVVALKSSSSSSSMA